MLKFIFVVTGPHQGIVGKGNNCGVVAGGYQSELHYYNLFISAIRNRQVKKYFVDHGNSSKLVPLRQCLALPTLSSNNSDVN